MLIFREFFNTQSDQNILQSAPNCTIFSKFYQESYIILATYIVILVLSSQPVNFKHSHSGTTSNIPNHRRITMKAT